MANDYFAKVKYRARDGYISTAYLDDIRTGEGTDKHTDIPIICAWDEDTQEWIQVDDWDWFLDEWTGHYVKVTHKVNTPEPEPFKRIQPKRLTRRQRRIK